MVVRMRHTRAHTANRRSHHALKSVPLALCKECGSPKMPHAICEVCGKYKGREVLDVHSALARKERRAKEKAQNSER